MKTEVPKLNWRTFITAKEDADPGVIAALDKYFEPFAQPKMEGNTVIDGHPCLKCGEKLCGGLVDSLIGMGGFEWGLAHGEGHCRNCKWPTRLYHSIYDEQEEPVMTIRGFLLQYHPSVVETSEQAAA